MKRTKHLLGMVLALSAVLSLPVYAQAADYHFTTEAPDD